MLKKGSIEQKGRKFFIFFFSLIFSAALLPLQFLG